MDRERQILERVLSLKQVIREDRSGQVDLHELSALGAWGVAVEAGLRVHLHDQDIQILEGLCRRFARILDQNVNELYQLQESVAVRGRM